MPAFLEDYTMIDEIGSGGYATVYKVRHNQLDYIRAIRVLDKTISSTKDALYLKFLDECKLLLRLGNGNHPNIVHIYQPLLRANKALVEMDFIDGEDLTHYLKKKKFIEIDDVLKLVEEISSALAYCHHEIYKFCYETLFIFYTLTPLHCLSRRGTAERCANQGRCRARGGVSAVAELSACGRIG